MAIEGQTNQPGDQNQQTPPPEGNQNAGQQNQQGQQQQQQQGAGQQQQTGDPNAARRDQGVLADLQKERKQRQALEQRLRDQETALENERRRVQALAGVTPQSDSDAEAAVVREQFAKLFPGLARLNNEQLLERLEGLLSQADVHEDTTKRYWADRARQMTSGVIERVSKELGGELSERQISRIRSAYAAAAEADPEFLARHEAGDQKLIEEFAKEWIEDWFEPARRKVVTNEVGRLRPVPGGRDRSINAAAGAGKKLDFKNEKDVEDAMVASFRQHGGTFRE